MEKSKKIKIYIGLFYLLLVSLFLYFIFTKFSFEEITSYDFVKNNRDYFLQLKDTNLLLLSILFIFFIIIWVFAAGFGSPIAIFGGFIFGKWTGTLLVALGLSIGATILYIFANYFLKDFIRDKFLNKYQNLESKFKKSEFIYLLFFRFIGGIPFVVANVLPCIFNVKIFNYFLATLIGLLPSIFIVCSVGSGLEIIISENLEAPSIIDLITSKEIYLPIVAFFILIIVSISMRKLFYK